MATNQAETPAPAPVSDAASPSEVSVKPRKQFISPTSSFVDFVELESEYFTDEGMARAEFYNPHKERKIKKPTKDYETCIHLLKGSVGIGLLAMPNAFRNAGWLLGTIGSILIGVICVYAIDTLLRCQLIQCKRLRVPFLTLPRSMRIAFLNGPRCFHPLAGLVPYFVDFFLIAFQIGICTAYVIYISDTIKSIVEILGGSKIRLEFYQLMIFIPIVLINYIRNLKKLTPISLAANILIILAFLGVLYFLVKDSTWALDNVKMVTNTPQTIPLFVGTMMFALEAVGVIVALEHNMEHPQHFLGWKGIFPWSLSLVITMYVLMGLLGYLKYGESIHDVITKSLPKKEKLALVIRGVYALCIFGSYPLQCYVSLEIIWGNYLVRHIKDPKNECWIEYTLRTAVVILTFVLALSIKNIDLVISLVGAFCLSFLGVIFPFVLELCTLWPDQLGRGRHILYKDSFFILIGFLMLVSGTYMSLQELFKTKE